MPTQKTRRELSYEEKLEITFEHAKETNLHSAWKETQDPDRAWVILSAYQEKLSDLENLARNLALSADLRNAGFGVTFLNGVRTTPDGTPDDIRRIEHAILAHINPKGSDGNIRMLRILTPLASQYEQPGFLWKPKGKTAFSVLLASGEVSSENCEIFPEKIDEAYSYLKAITHPSIKIHFESAIYLKSWIARLAERHLRKD